MTELISALPGKTERVNPNRFADGIFAPPAGKYVTEVEVVLVLYKPPLQPGPPFDFEIYPGKEKLTVLVYHDTPGLSSCDAQAKGERGAPSGIEGTGICSGSGRVGLGLPG